MESAVKNQQERRVPAPKRRRRGACSGCKTSKVTGELLVSIARYGQTCSYTVPVQRQRTKSQSSSASLYLDDTALVSTASPNFSYNFSQDAFDQFGLLDEILVSPEDAPRNGYRDTSDPFALDWDATAAMKPEDVDIQQRARSANFELDIVDSNIKSKGYTNVPRDEINPNLGDTSGQDHVFNDTSVCGMVVQQLLQQRGFLGEERSQVESALVQLGSFTRAADCALLPMYCGTPQGEVWKLVLNEDWRKAGIRAAFNIYTGLGDFLCESEMQRLADEVLTPSPVESLSLVLVLGVVATGRHVLENQATSIPVDLSASQKVFAEACVRIQPFLLGHNSLLKLQALTTLAAMSAHSSSAITFDLISNATSCIQILRANRESPSDGELLPEVKKQRDLNLATYAIYCLEHQFDMELVHSRPNDRRLKLLVMRHKSQPPQMQARDDEDFRVGWMSSQVEYVQLCSKIARLHENADEKGDVLQTLKKDLQTWKADLPGQYHDIDQPYPHNIASDSRKLWLFCQYHGFSLRIQMMQLRDALVGRESDARSQCLHSARIVLDATNLLPPSVILSNRNVCELVSSATCLCFAAGICNPSASAEAFLRDLGLACGFLAKIAAGNQAPFTAATCLLRTAQKLVEGSRPLENLEKSGLDPTLFFGIH